MASRGLGGFIAEGRAAARPSLTQAALAARVGCSVAMIGKIEAGSRIPSPELMTAIVRALQLDAADLEVVRERTLSARGASALVGAAKLGRDNASRASELKGRLKGLVATAVKASSQLDEVIDYAIKRPTPLFVELIGVINDIPPTFLEERAIASNRGRAGERVRRQMLEVFQRSQRELRGPYVDFFRAGSAGAGIGGAAGAAAGFGTYAAVTAFATASTGRAIASLRGIAQEKAAMAWLGGGALAAGGAGIAGGTVVLASIVAVPIVAVAGGVLLGQGSQILRKQQSNAKRLGEAERVQASNESVIELFRARVELIGSAVRVADVKVETAAEVLKEHPVLAAAMGPSNGAGGEEASLRVPFGELSLEQQRALETLGRVATSLSALLTLPIAVKITTQKLPDLALDDALEDEQSVGQPILDRGSAEENEYIDFAIEQLLAEIAMA